MQESHYDFSISILNDGGDDSIFCGKCCASIIFAIGIVSIVPTSIAYSRIDNYINPYSGNLVTEYRMDEYLPKETIINEDVYHKQYAFVSDWDKVIAKDYRKDKNRVHFNYVCASDGEYADLPIFYYSGYQIVESVAGDVVGIVPAERGTNNRVRVMLHKTDVPIDVDVSYKDPALNQISLIFSVGILIILFCYSCFHVSKQKNDKSNNC